MRIPESRLRPDGLKIKRRIQAYLAYKALICEFSLPWAIDRAPKTKVFMDVMIYFGNRSHGDPDNIRKGIQDAIYANDSMVAGRVDFEYDPENPRVEIEIRQGGCR